MNGEITHILNTIKEKFTDDSDLLWTHYETAEEVRHELDNYIEHIRQGDESCFEQLYVHFLPTATFQEHAIQNYWTEEYMALAGRFDTLYEQWKNRADHR